jgi:uncharacterized repeat protein (TIGR03803 family)
MNSSKNLLSVRKLAAAAIAAIIPACLGAPPPPVGISLSSLYAFTNAATPAAGLVQGTNGNFYGTTMAGGTKGNGTVFMVTPAGVFTNLVLFNGTNGATPEAPLYLDANGYFYGTTYSGGTNSHGTVFRMSHSGVFTNLVKFQGTNGANPLGGLVRGPKGLFYGTTSAGGSNGLGEVFSWSPAAGVSNLFSFKGTNGSNPRGGLVVGLDGNLYGTTFQGGANGQGTVFQLSQSNKLKTLVSFSLANGALPWGLVQAANSNLFGVTYSGGTNILGTVFKITYAGKLTTLASFNIGTNNGSIPKAPVVLGKDGFLYGTTWEGGLYGYGVIFRISTSGGTVSNLVSFSGANGAFSAAGLTQASDGNFYGTTTGGGANGFGNIFELSGFAPSIIQQPASQSFALGKTNLFTVGAAGSAPLSYQWVLDGTNHLANGGHIAGATNSQLTIGPEALPDAGSYSVIVSNSVGAVTSSVVTLTIPAPTLAITSPNAYSTMTNATLTVRGTAAGNYGVTNVQYQLNGGTNWTSVTNKTQWTNWSATVLLTAGSNVFKAYSVDPLGHHSQTNSVTVFYMSRSPITLKTNGFGSITRGFTGTNLALGTNYTVTAVPNSGNLFSNWTGTLTTTNNPLTFLMASNMTLTANFVTNSFLGAAGTYNGLFYPVAGAGAQSSGLLGGLTVGKLGAYTGKLYLGGTNYAVGGNFDLFGNASNQVTQASGLGPLSLAMHLNWDSAPPQITGTVQGTNGGAWTAQLTNELAGTGLGSAEYTLLIPPGTNAPAGSPGGDGYALITNHLGSVTVTGALADGAAFSQTIAESANLRLAFYATPYTNGLLLGWLDLSRSAPAGSLTWIRPAAAAGLFPNGYTNVVTVQSSAWTNPGTNTNGLLTPNEQLDVSGAFLAAPLIFHVAINYTNDDLAVYTGGPTNSLSSTINPKNGLLNIIFGNGNSNKTTTGTGAILQNDAHGGGYFITSTNTGSFTLHP